MLLRGMIFDVDGTLVDTNPTHVEAWRRAFKRLGYDISPERITIEIGKGGDLLVPSILGEDVETRQGKALLFLALRERRIRTALATSSDKKHLEAICASAGIDLPGLADVLVTKDEAEASKPAPRRMLHGRRHGLRCSGLPGSGSRVPRPVVGRHFRGGAAPGRRLWGVARHRSSLFRPRWCARACVPGGSHQPLSLATTQERQ